MLRFSKGIRLFISMLLVLAFIGAVAVPQGVLAAEDFTSLATRAVQNNYELFQSGTPVDDGWSSFGAYDGYVLWKAGQDLANWVYDEESFKDKVLEKTYEILSGPNKKTINWAGQEVYAYSSKLLAQHLLANKAFRESQYADPLLEVLNVRQQSTGNGSFEDNAFGDIAAFELLGRAGVVDHVYDKNAAVACILSQQDASTGAWTGSWNDVMATAQAVRALHYLRDYASQEQAWAVETAITNGLAWLKQRQKDDGSFQDDSNWDDPVIDTCEVIYTLTLLDIDPRSWKSSQGSSPVAYLLNGALNEDGTFGTGKNIMDNTWVLDACLMLDATVKPALLISPSQAAVNVGSSQSFTATLFRINGFEDNVTQSASWEVSDNKIAAIKNPGVVEGLAPGTTTVRAVYDSLTATATLTVNHSGSGSGTPSAAPTVTVYIAVVGRSGNLLYYPGSVELSSQDQFGVTAMGALAKTGLSWEFSDRYPGFIVAIEGERNEGMNGWCYSVNGSMPSVLPRDCSVKRNDKIIFWYSTSVMSDGPKWEDLLKSGSSQATQTVTVPAQVVQVVKETVAKYQGTLQTLAAEIRVLNIERVMSRTAAEELRRELANNVVSLAVKAGAEETVLADPKQEISMLIPPMALNEAIEISVKELEPEKSNLLYTDKLVSSLYEFGPSRLRFASPITIMLKLPVDESVKLELLTPAWYDEEKRQWVPIPGVIDAEKGLAVFQTDHFTKFAVIELAEAAQDVEPKTPSQQIVFPDMTGKFEWAKEALEYLAAKGIVRGTGRGFEPSRTVTRAEFTAMIANALSLNPDRVKGTEFSDVKYEDWFSGVIGAAVNQGVVFGYPDGTFGPSRSITRFEMAAILARLPGVTKKGDQPVVTLKDAGSVPAWATKSVEQVVGNGLMKGREASVFKGREKASRAEAAVAIYRYLQLLNRSQKAN